MIRLFIARIGIVFFSTRNSMPKTTSKSSIGTAVISVCPSHMPSFKVTYFAIPIVGSAFELTAFIQLESFSNFRPSLFASASEIKLCAAPMSTITLFVALPLIVAFTNMSPFSATLFVSITCFFMAPRNQSAPIRVGSSSSSSTFSSFSCPYRRKEACKALKAVL